MNPYESKALLSQYLLFHYGAPDEILPFTDGPVSGLGYPARYARAATEGLRAGPTARALDLGCGVGGITFELARTYREVLGIDFSRRFIAAARELQRTGRTTYDRVEEGHLTTQQVARVTNEIDRSRVQFEAGDATALRDDIGTFDLIVMANLLDRLPDPLRCLRRLPTITRPGGRVVISSPYTWLAEYTPRRRWLGGVVRGGKAVRTHDSIARAMAPGFTLTRRIDMPFTIRDHARKFQWAVADATIWERRAD